MSASERVVVGHLYPGYLNIYADRGNIAVLASRAAWRGVELDVRTIGPGPFGGGVRSVAFTPDGRYLATANANGTVYLLRVGPPAP